MNSSTNAERAGAGRDIRAVVSWLALVLGPLAWVVLGVSVIWDGEQVAAGVHLTGLGLEALPREGSGDPVASAGEP